MSGFGGMVYRDYYPSGLNVCRRNRAFASAISAILLFSTVLCGCSLIQPSRKELAEANAFLYLEPVALDVSLTLQSGGTAMSYDTQILMEGDMAEWEGDAYVSFSGIPFHQSCRSACDGLEAGKKWNEQWAKTELKAPTVNLKAWLSELASGKGTYLARSVIPKEDSKGLIPLDRESYRVMLRNFAVDWDALCDVNLDSLFGGDTLLTQYDTVDVTMYFQTADWELSAVLIQAEHSDGAVTCKVLVSRSEQGPSIMFGELEEGLLSEDWEICREE